MLNSLAANFAWEGPFAQADAKPVDPKLWDEAKKRDPNEGKHVLVHVFSVAGIHAVNTIELAEDITSTYACEAHGEVALWGRIAVFELGYRAEFCMIKKLWVQTRLLTSDGRVDKAIVRDLSNRYQCDVEIV